MSKVFEPMVRVVTCAAINGIGLLVQPVVAMEFVAEGINEVQCRSRALDAAGPYLGNCKVISVMEKPSDFQLDCEAIG